MQFEEESIKSYLRQGLPQNGQKNRIEKKRKGKKRGEKEQKKATESERRAIEFEQKGKRRRKKVKKNIEKSSELKRKYEKKKHRKRWNDNSNVMSSGYDLLTTSNICDIRTTEFEQLRLKKIEMQENLITIVLNLY